MTPVFYPLLVSRLEATAGAFESVQRLLQAPSLMTRMLS